MRISEYFTLGRSQPTLDFVDVDIFGDIKVFVDPRALRMLPSQWGAECVYLVKNFFGTVLKLIRNGEDTSAQKLLASLREPNETHLGLSQDRAQGRALGVGSAVNVWDSLRKSEAIRTGLLEDLEDTILMVEGVSLDIVSDIIINIIRWPLVEYTNAMAQLYGIPLSEGVASGPLWDPKKHEWFQQYVNLPITNYGKILLVPKSIVRRKMLYDLQDYYNNYILEDLQERELSSNSELVQLLKNGNRRVTKKSLKEKYGQSKTFVINETLKNPDLLRQYRSDKRNSYPPPLEHETLAIVEDSDPPNWDDLLNQAINVAAGRSSATEYEEAIEGLFSALFYPSLAHPQVQHEIHNGRKRIDITYTNLALKGFFFWLSTNYPAMHVFVECKNYGREIGNPELDQLSGRFSPSRGQFGILACRTFENKELFIQRCIDTAKDQRGYIIPIDDEDLQELTALKKAYDDRGEYFFFKRRFDRLIM
jgi:hypothetical protein